MQITIITEDMTDKDCTMLQAIIDLHFTKNKKKDEITLQVNLDTQPAQDALAAFGTSAFAAPQVQAEQRATNQAVIAAVNSIPVAPGTVETDKDGFPWDARIHSSNHQKVAEGTWRKKRGVDPALVTQVEAELRAVMGAPQVQAQQQAPAAAPPPPVAADPLSIPDALRRPQPVPEAPPAAPVPAPPVGTDPMSQYVALVQRASAAVGTGKVRQDQINATLGQYGLTSIPMLANRLDLLPVIAQAIDALITTAG